MVRVRVRIRVRVRVGDRVRPLSLRVLGCEAASMPCVATGRGTKCSGGTGAGLPVAWI